MSDSEKFKGLVAVTNSFTSKNSEQIKKLIHAIINMHTLTASCTVANQFLVNIKFFLEKIGDMSNQREDILFTSAVRDFVDDVTINILKIFSIFQGAKNADAVNEFIAKNIFNKNVDTYSDSHLRVIAGYHHVDQGRHNDVIFISVLHGNPYIIEQTPTIILNAIRDAYMETMAKIGYSISDIYAHEKDIRECIHTTTEYDDPESLFFNGVPYWANNGPNLQLETQGQKLENLQLMLLSTVGESGKEEKFGAIINGSTTFERMLTEWGDSEFNSEAPIHEILTSSLMQFGSSSKDKAYADFVNGNSIPQ